MAADVCPVTRLRCEHVQMCAVLVCGLDRTLHPISETRLTRAEQYALAMSERTVTRDTDAA